MNGRLLLVATALAVLPALLTGCGGNGQEGAADHRGAAASASPGDGGGTLVTITATDLDFEPDEVTAPPGEVTITYVNEGQLPHTLLVDAPKPDLRLRVDQNGDTDRATVTFEPGTYVLYCDIPGHRIAGMETTLTVQ